jgi:hypothetical protein
MMKVFALVLGTALMLSACGLTKKQLGLARSTPDETAVETRQPLDLPPDYNVLPD